MNIVQPQVTLIDHSNLLTTIERGGRLCYKSEDKIGPGSAEPFIERLKNMKHESVLEHSMITMQFITDRGVTHEAVRHRIAAFAQESTRYCNYSKDKYGNEITVIDPFFFDPNEERVPVIVPMVQQDLNTHKLKLYADGSNFRFDLNSFDVWLISCLWAEWGYNTLTQQFKRAAQEARTVLPNSLKTEIQITANAREWRHILKLRTSREAHPQIRQIMVPVAHEFAKRWPVLFEDFKDVEHTHPAAFVQG